MDRRASWCSIEPSDPASSERASLLPSQGTRREIGVSQPEIGAALRPSAAYALVMSDSHKANSMNFNRGKNV